MRRPLIVMFAACLAVGGCGSDDDDEAASTTTTGAPTTTAPSTTTSTSGTSAAPPAATPDPAALATVVEGLDVPWDVAFVDADTLFVTERPGRVRLVDGGVLRPEPVLSPPVSAVGEGGLLGIALHPDFPEQRFAYLYATTDDGNRVTRYEVGDDLGFAGEEVLLDGIPAARNHDGGRLAFGPDGMLYVTTGDAGEPSTAADVGSLAGKILRIAPDGSVPGDNPFPGSPVWSYGHRNPQGLAWDAEGRMYASEHGPSGEFGLCCNDEVNRIEAGGFHGWPFVTAAGPTGRGEPPAEPIPPAATSGSGVTWAPAGVAVVGDSLVVATLRGERLLRFPVAGDGTLGEPEVARDDLGRLRIAAVAPDGCLWVGTSNLDGRGDPAGGDDRLLRAC